LRFSVARRDATGVRLITRNGNAFPGHTASQQRDLGASGRLSLAFRNAHIARMCGRVIQSSGPLRYGIVEGMDMRDSRTHNYPPRWNGAPSQELLVIRRNHDTGKVSLDPLRWGLIPYWCKDSKGGRKPINAKSETVQKLPMFRDAYRRRRCILPVDGFFEWKAIKGQKSQAALRYCHEGWPAVRHRGHLGKLEGPRVLRYRSIWNVWKTPGRSIRTAGIEMEFTGI
jgi:putative SOS response-associated peptidase YedK